MQFLYDTLLQEFGKREIARTEIPVALTDNLNPKFEIRPYQREAFQRFLLYYEQPFEGKPHRPYHLLFNMATGSGKTLVMAGLMLYLYEKGYRNFLFFVDSNNIIQKTRDNFLNTRSGKYLFDSKIQIDGREVLIKTVDNFDEADTDNINICFTTIQQLHTNLTRQKENSLTFEDFQNRKVVLLADEAHHLNAATRRQGEIFGGWENTVLEIHRQNLDNLLLEFTATLDMSNRDIAAKYADKIIFKYDLAQFRIDRYSKEINLIRSYYDEHDRILQALVLNQYRQELAGQHNLNLKPVILFKAKRTIAESERNKENFHQLIDNLTPADMARIRKTSTVEVVQKAFRFFAGKHLTDRALAERIRANFKPANCLSANNDAEAERNQLLLNSLEDDNNPIRAVFAVQKLNEGWDVLNLFDIVRLYEDRDGKNGKPGPTTMAEAQLIGRGARYFPFRTSSADDLYRRKYDQDIDNDLKMLEELYYHTQEDSRYISEIKQALIATGIAADDADLVERHHRLKASFKQTDLYQNGYVFFNGKVPKTFDRVRAIQDLGVSKKNIRYMLSSGVGKVTKAFPFELEQETDQQSGKDWPLAQIPQHIVRYALTQNPFFYFSSLRRYFPKLTSTTEFITSADYLGSLEITLYGTTLRRNNPTHEDLLRAVQTLLSSIEADIKANLTEYEGTAEFYKDFIHNIFKNKTLRIPRTDERAKGQEHVVADKDWYAYEANYGTSEEKDFVEMFARRFEGLTQKFDDIYLLRSEREIKIYDPQGRAFEPDFVLFLTQKGTESLTYQVFIEPKGDHLIATDKWKEDFLKQIRAQNLTINLESDRYRITAVPFYNNRNENEFRQSLESVWL